jgi:hypothetical protein
LSLPVITDKFRLKLFPVIRWETWIKFQVQRIPVFKKTGGRMARTVVAIYDDFQSANNAVRELVDGGFPRDNISIIASNNEGDYGYKGTAKDTAGDETVADETGTGAGVGAGIGAAVGGIGGLLVGLGALTIPGIGPVIAAGPLAVALSTLTGAGVGAVAGGVTGGLLGALIGLGIPEQEAEYYAEGVRRGGVLVTVQADEHNTDVIIDTLNRYHPIDMNERAGQWREQGWNSFDPQGEPYTSQPEQLGGERWVTGEYDPGFDPDSQVYHEHYEHALADTGYPFDYYAPAYRYGFMLGRDARYQNRRWSEIEPDVRRNWEREHPDTWDRFKVAIQHAWNDTVR